MSCSSETIIRVAVPENGEAVFVLAATKLADGTDGPVMTGCNLRIRNEKREVTETFTGISGENENLQDGFLITIPPVFAVANRGRTYAESLLACVYSTGMVYVPITIRL